MKKEWKKVLSLVMALAMVLTACPFVFAEGEEAEEVTPVVPSTYDFAEFFETSDEFEGVPATDYPNATLTRVDTPNWKAGAYWRGGYNLNTADYTKYTARAGYASRAYSDTKNTTLVLASGTGSTKRVPNMTITYQPPGYTKKETSDIVPHYDGTSQIYGDGGYTAQTFWPYGGSIGYGFGEGVAMPNTGTTNDVQPAVHFVAPRDGIINPEFRAYSNGRTDIVYRIYKKVTNTEWETIYPSPDEASVTIDGDYSKVSSNAGFCYTLDDHEKQGWLMVSSDGTYRNDGLVWVEAGDEIVLRFAQMAPNGPSTGFTLDTLKMHYVTACEFSYFSDTRTVDLRVDGAENITYTVAEDSGLTATDVAGVFTVAQNFVDGTVVPVTVTVGTSTAIINAKLTAVPTYDLAEMFYTTNDYSESLTYAERYATKTQNPKTANNGTGVWSVGYYRYNALNTFAPYNSLQRALYYRAYEDTSYTGRDANMIYSDSSAYLNSSSDPASASWAKHDQDGGYANISTNTTYGAIGYSFGNNTYLSNSSSGSTTNTSYIFQPSVVFTAPYSGVINPTFKAASSDANTFTYRMYKEDASTGALTQIYPLASEAENWVQPSTVVAGAYPVSDICNTNWGMLPSSATGWLVQDKGAVRVNKGDKIVLRFAQYNNSSKTFGISELKMNYLGRFGEDDELLLSAPFANYEELYEVVTPRDKKVDLSRELLNPEAKGTMEYTITGNTEVLRETADAGVYELTGKINAGGEAAVVTAAYYSKGKDPAKGDKPLYTTSTKVYVNAASMAVDTFSYDLFKSTQLGYDNDGFLLPYYTNETERAMYGEIDLGLADEWVNSAVTFSVENKIQYLGNGRIRVVGKHDFTDAGGTFPNHGSSQKPTTTAPSYNGHPAVRDTTTAGATPVVMTIKAPDGGVRKFNIWTFNAKVHGDTASETYGFDYANYYVPNAVTRFEGFVDMTATNGGSFVPMYRDNGRNSNISPVSDDMYLQAETTSYWFPKVPSFSTGGELIMFSYNKTNWEDYTPAEYVDFDGASWTFEAPKSGVVNVANFMTDKLHTNNNYHFVSNAVVYVRHYKANGTYTELIKRTYGSNYGSNSTDGIFSDATETTGTMVESLEEDGTMNITVAKGDIIRVILANNTDTTAVSTLVKKNSKNANDTTAYLPDPTFTYVAKFADMFEGTSLYVTPSSFEGLTDGNNVLALFYDQTGKLIEKVNGETIITNPVDGKYVDIPFSSSADASYAKVFFWESLDNIKPLAGDILVRK